MRGNNAAFLLDSLTTAVLQVDANLRLNSLNSAARELLALSGAGPLGEPLPRLLPRADALHAAALASLARQQGTTLRELVIPLGADGATTVTADCTFTPLEAGGLLLEIVALDRHLLISREAALLAEQQIRRRLAQTLAHEIKNPLGGIRGAAQLLARELPDSNLQEYTNIIIDEADRLRNLVDRMLGPNQLPQYKQLNIHEALERVAAIIHAESNDAIKILRDYDPSIPDMMGDKELLIQAFLNIVRNAMQALLEAGMSDGVIRLRTRIQRQFTIGRRHHPLVCRVDILDNGPGIPQDMIENIFYPMISGRAEGTGLGLTISQHLIHQHHGLIECQSETGQTRFTLYLPMEVQHAEV